MAFPPLSPSVAEPSAARDPAGSASWVAAILVAPFLGTLVLPGPLAPRRPCGRAAGPHHRQPGSGTAYAGDPGAAAAATGRYRSRVRRGS